jgi:hypothetical protein
MATKNLVPRGSGEGGIGVASKSWGSAHFNSGNFNHELKVSGVSVSTGSAGGIGGKWLDSIAAGDIYYTGGKVGIGTDSPAERLDVAGNTQFSGHILPAVSGQFDIGTPSLTVRDLYLSTGSLHIGDASIKSSSAGRISIPGGIDFSGSILPSENDVFDIGDPTHKVRDLYLGPTSLHIGDAIISSSTETVQFPTGIEIGGVPIDVNEDDRVVFGPSGLLVGSAKVIPDPSDPESLYFAKPPQTQDAEGNPVTLLSSDKLGLGTSAVLDTNPGDIKFKLLTDQDRFVVGTTGDGDLESGWYRFNDFKVKGATDIGAHSLNPVDTRIYSDPSSFIFFTEDSFGNRVAHLLGGDEEVSVANTLSIGISAKVDSSDSPEDIEFTHTDGESYSLINGDSDSVGVNGLPVRQGFQPASLGANPSPLLIDGGSF